MLDAANGVGEEKVKQFAKYIGEALTIKTVNDGSGKLNYRVGKSYIWVEIGYDLLWNKFRTCC